MSSTVVSRDGLTDLLDSPDLLRNTTSSHCMTRSPIATCSSVLAGHLTTGAYWGRCASTAIPSITSAIDFCWLSTSPELRARRGKLVSLHRGTKLPCRRKSTWSNPNCAKRLSPFFDIAAMHIIAQSRLTICQQSVAHTVEPRRAGKQLRVNTGLTIARHQPRGNTTFALLESLPQCLYDQSRRLCISPSAIPSTTASPPTTPTATTDISAVAAVANQFSEAASKRD